MCREEEYVLGRSLAAEEAQSGAYKLTLEPANPG